MRKTLVMILGAAVAGVVLHGAPQAPGSARPAESKAGTVSGRITAADSGKPLRRARVTLVPATQPAGGPAITANTNAAGQFEAKEVPPGSYFVAATRSGYLGLQYGQRRSREKGLSVEVRAGVIVERIDVELPRGGVLAGTVSDELGEPYPGVRVEALCLRYDRGRRVPFPAGVATTDDRGWFRISGLEPGNYYVSASSAETWWTEKKEAWGYASTYFPSAPNEHGRPIALGASAIKSGIHLALQASRAVRVSGRILRETGDPVPPGSGVSLAYSYPGVIMTAGTRSTRTDATGAFEFRNVAGGSYMVSAAGASHAVTVAGEEISNLLLVSRTGSTVNGTLLTDEGTPPPFSTQGVRVLLDAPFGNVLGTVRVVQMDTDWSFKLQNLGGPFLFRLIGLPDGWMLQSVRLDDHDITDVPWDAPTGGREFSGLTMVVTRKAGTVGGTVAESNDKPTGAATVLLFADDPGLWIPGSRVVRTTRPGADGRFSITGLPGGTYRAVALDFVEEGQWESADFLEQVRGEAKRFVLEEGREETIALKVPRR